MMNDLASFGAAILIILLYAADYGGAVVCDFQEYETCTNRFLERDFTYFEEVIKLYPRRRLRIDATEIAQFCSGFQELVQCIVIQYVNCNAPDAEKEKVIRAMVNVLKLWCNEEDRSIIQTALQHAHCYLGAEERCRSSNVTMFTWKEILRFERLLDRRHTCNALIEHGSCILREYNGQRCSSWLGRTALDKTIRSWGGTYCSSAPGPKRGCRTWTTFIYVLLTLCITMTTDLKFEVRCAPPSFIGRTVFFDR
ncbi:uncharacterized protein LOC111243838 [Varroa destructor]|uniref:Uncharacterized protein n=1 Tax=Varroa destructor TaxID=109461 RepID=A0A7M7J275_VARDE|nr:uncharacterized protein LOC111243838 [Varroa destructor]XP_022645757.1 uncharacterized protein LOC111243838 [Varroa destructor]